MKSKLTTRQKLRVAELYFLEKMPRYKIQEKYNITPKNLTDILNWVWSLDYTEEIKNRKNEIEMLLSLDNHISKSKTKKNKPKFY